MSKKHHKKGLLTGAVKRGASTAQATSDSKQPCATGKSPSSKLSVNQSQRRVSKATSSQPGSVQVTPTKPALKDRTIDPVTGKKKGTLFSAAPAAPSSAHPTRKHDYHSKPDHPQPGPSSHSTLVRGSASGKQTDAAGGAKQTGPGAVGRKTGKGSKYKRKRASKAASADGTEKADRNCEHTATGAGAASSTPATGKSNWERMKESALQQSEAALKPPQHKRRKKLLEGVSGSAVVGSGSDAVSADGIREGRLVPKGEDASVTPVLALDCEMVGVGNLEVKAKGRDALARVCLVNDHGQVLLDLFVRPKEKVTDFRTKFSGIRPKDIADGVPHEQAMKQVYDILSGKTLVGHAVHNDIKILALQGAVPRSSIRDTALYAPLMARNSVHGKLRPRPLRHVAKQELGVEIQQGEHNPAQDARAALYVYHKHRDIWEMSIKAGTLKLPGLRASAKLTKGSKFQRKMRAEEGLPSLKALGHTAGGNVDSDDEFAPPNAASVARMTARMTRQMDDELLDS